MPIQILVIEDDSDIRRNMKKILEGEGFLVIVAENGQLALDYLHSATDLPHIILLDLMMPVMDGYEFRDSQLKIVKLADIPVIILSADGLLEEKRSKIGARAALKKPASIDAILDAIETVLPEAC